MSKRLPKKLKKIRRDFRLCYGRGRYDEAHEMADWVYALQLDEKRTPRKRRLP